MPAVSGSSRRISLSSAAQFVVTFPYSKEMVAALKTAIPLAMWDREIRVWRVGVGSWKEVLNFAANHGFMVEKQVETKIFELQATQAASRAVFTDMEIPVPEGLEYMPFQKAGIAFALKVLGDIA